MSSMFDEALRETRMPTAEDLDITFPVRREPKKEDVGSNGGAGEHGGAAAAPATAAESHADAAGSSNSEPLPQRDEPDDGEHTDSTQAQIEARAARTAPEEPEEAPAEVEEAPEAIEAPEEPVARPRAVAPRTLADVLANTEGTHPATFARVAFNAGPKADSLSLTRFPQRLVDELRLRLAPSTGGEFAEAISATAIVTAFLTAGLGLDLEVDENTANASDAFRRDAPRLASIEDRLDETLDNIDQLGGALKLALKRIAATGQTVDGLELAAAYLVADRVSTVTTSETTENTVDVAQKKVLVTRDRIKASAKAQRTIDQQRNERSNA